MASEILAIPEQHLQEVIDIIRAGLLDQRHNTLPEVKQQLRDWCNSEELYLKRLAEDK